VVVELGQSGKVFEDNAISPSGDKLALIDKASFVVLSIPGQSEELWYPDNFTRLCCGFNDGRYGRKVAKAQFARTVIPTYSRTVLSDRSVFIACIEGFVDIHDISTGKRLGKISFTQGRRCWNLAISPNGEVLAIALGSGEVFLYAEGEDREFNASPIPVVTEPERMDLRLVNCLAFSPDSLHLSVCTSDNIIRTYTVDMPCRQATLVQSYNRQLDDKACKDPYYGVTDITLYFSSINKTDRSSSHSSSLLIVSYAKKAYPVLVGNIVFPGKELKILPMGEVYKDTNCRVAYSPISSAALIITRTGTVKLVNCATKSSGWTVVDLSKEKMDDMKPWRYCSLAFSRDGYRGLALDRRGKLLIVEFSAGRSDTI
jgi:WD40 repeat protein